MKPWIERWHRLGITAKFATAFGLLVALIMLVSLISYMALTAVRRQTEAAIVTSMEVQRLVLEMDAGMQRARQLERDLFLRWPAVGFSQAVETYAARHSDQIDQVMALSASLQQLIAQSDVSEALRESEVSLNFYLSAADRYAAAFDEAVDLATALATDQTGAQARLADHSELLRTSLEQSSALEGGDPTLMLLYREMQSFEKDYLVTRQRPTMQSAFNVAGLLRESIASSPSLDGDERTLALASLENYLTVADEILLLDVEIRRKLNEFDLQAQAVDPISEELIALASAETQRAREQIARTSRMATTLLAMAILAAVALAVVIGMALNNSITRNVVTLTKAAGELHGGNLEIRAQIDSADELGQLAESFNAMAARINRLVGTLEQRVAARTADLTRANVQLQQEISERARAEEEARRAQDAAEAASEAKSAFLATMSHEIRTPMNAVIGMTSLLLDTDLTVEQRQFVETIRESGDDLLTVINDILDFSKIEAGRMELENQPFDLRHCIEGALDLLAPKAAEKRLNLAYLMEPQVPTAIYGDVTRLRQILVNLLDNAVKFTSQGEVVLSVHCAENGVDGPSGEPHLATIHFSVRDTGIGIAAQQMDRLFQPFSQVDASMTRRYGGTGLGLAISQHLTHIMGGRLWAESEGVPGKGSNFHFTIQAQTAPSPPPPFLQGLHADLSDRRVLIVDDSATNRQILTLQTEAWGMLSRATSSPAQALQWIRQGHPFDVALLDMQLGRPGSKMDEEVMSSDSHEMDGLMLAGLLQREQAGLDVALHVVLLSSGQQGGKAEGAEIAAFLTKPIKASQLYDVLVQIFAEDAVVLPTEERAPQPLFDPQMGRRLRLRILVAEDNVINQQVALSFLDRLGYRADVAANGLEVLSSLRRQPYDVVLMDVQMPEMDGLEATRLIRQLAPSELATEAQPRIIAMTANAMREDCDICLAAGMDDYLSKPLQVEELVKALSKCRPQRRQATGIQTGPAEAPVTQPPPTSISSEVLDPQALQQLRSTLGSQADQMLPGLLQGFEQDGERLLAQARQALQQRQADDLHRAAHTLKSTSATFGATALSATARELESLAGEGRFDGAEQILAQVEAEFALAKAALEKAYEQL
jgi:signal transduction histidine kinase/DNA-binding response OmpR family regulator